MTLRQWFERGGADVPAVRRDEVDKYEAYLTLLTQWNERMSLVSPKSLETAFATHFIDSIRTSDAAAPYSSRGISDVGSGAGFPGLVHAIRYPESRIRLFERSLKKQTFLAAVVTHLALDHVELDGAFPENVRRDGVFMARAVFPRDELFPFFRRTLMPGAFLVTNLGGQRPVEPPPPDFLLEKEERYLLPQECGERRLEILKFVPRGTKAKRS